MLCVLLALYCIWYMYNKCVTIVVKLFPWSFNFSLNQWIPVQHLIALFNSIQFAIAANLLICFFFCCSRFSDQPREGKRNLISTTELSLFMVIFFFSRHSFLFKFKYNVQLGKLHVYWIFVKIWSQYCSQLPNN